MSNLIILANGQLADRDKVKTYIKTDSVIICADGGADHALALNLKPDLVVGDFDSLSVSTLDRLKALDVPLEKYPVNKDKTDLELALNAAMRYEPQEILLLTALGGRLDQQLANIMLLTHADWQPARLGLAEGAQIAWMMRGADKLYLEGRPGDTFSLVALSPVVKGITLSGCKWPLEQAQIELGSTLTISNRFEQARISVEIESGLALAVHIQSE